MMSNSPSLSAFQNTRKTIHLRPIKGLKVYDYSVRINPKRCYYICASEVLKYIASKPIADRKSITEEATEAINALIANKPDAAARTYVLDSEFVRSFSNEQIMTMVKNSNIKNCWIPKFYTDTKDTQASLPW